MEGSEEEARELRKATSPKGAGSCATGPEVSSRPAGRNLRALWPSPPKEGRSRAEASSLLSRRWNSGTE